ncbi:MAG: hypothetical protein PHI68_04855 [Candidatus Cloacimonetes bacterium]|nr:hypothetical protein [Candidatus Cloacimonadota bacterium]
MNQNHREVQTETQLGLRKRMIINTMSNYGKVIIGILITIFLTRILFLGLGREEYGFWALLWSIFGYSLLLDFGFGASIQKYTSESTVTGDWERYNRIVSTVFFNYMLFSVLIAAGTLVLSFNLHRIFNFNPANGYYFRKVMLIFGLGSALAFPLGFFTEILRGLQKMHTRNLIQICFMILNFVGMAVMLKLKLNLTGMAFVALGTNISASLTMMAVVKKLIPQFRIRLRFYDRSLLRTVMGFSVYAYLISFTNLIILKTDQLVISIFGSVAMVAIYQISIRMADTYQRFSAQFLDNLGPVSATLFASGNKSKMAEIMLQSNRLMGIISTMLLIPLIVFIKPLLMLWLNLNDYAGLICAVILMLSMYILLVFRSSSVYILLMANEQKVLARVALAEALINLVLSILLIRVMPGFVDLFGIEIENSPIIGVALGTFIPNFLFAIFFNIPKACRFAEIKIGYYFKIAVQRTILIGLSTFGMALFLQYLYHPEHLITVFFYILISFAIYLILTYFFGLETWEKGQIKSYLGILSRRSV